MPAKQKFYFTQDDFALALSKYTFTEATVFITVSLQPYLYKESFRNQYTGSQAELKDFIKRITDNAIIACEATKHHNCHYHIICDTILKNHVIDDFAKSFKKLGNTLTKKTFNLAEDNEYYHDDGILYLNQICWYLLKAYSDTDDLLNGAYETPYAVGWSQLTYIKKAKPTLRGIVTVKSKDDKTDTNTLDDGIMDTEDDIFIHPNLTFNLSTIKK